MCPFAFIPVYILLRITDFQPSVVACYLSLVHLKKTPVLMLSALKTHNYVLSYTKHSFSMG